MEEENKRVLILGFGISGRAAARLAEHLKMIPVPVDARHAPDEALFRESAFGWQEGTPLPHADLAVISPGIRPDSPMAQAARNAGASIIGELEFACRVLPCRIVAITGTNGKTTTTELTTALLQANGIRAQSAGNIGNALSDAALDVLLHNNLDVLVVESSSFQLETIQSFRPSTGALLNLASDHINRHGSMEGYAEAKLRLFRNMEGGNAVINANLPERYAQQIRARCRTETFSAAQNADFMLENGSIRFHGSPVIPLAEVPLKGNHNAENIMAALAILKAEAGEEALFSEATAEALRSFHPDVHRMEFFAEHNGIRFVDDSKATNPHSVNAALNTFGGKKNVILILGGLDKQMDFSSIRDDADKIKCAFLIGECKEKIYAALHDLFPCTLCATLEEATEQGARSAAPGDILALCPACASMDMFRDYKERGNRFKEAVHRLIRNS